MNTGSRSARSRFLTTGSIAAVVVAAGVAVAANIGILDASSDHDIGQLSATGDLAAPTAQPASTVVPAVLTNDVMQSFEVGSAGTVTVVAGADGLRLDNVVVTDGWSWTSTQPTGSELVVALDDGGQHLMFTARRNTDGSLAANVEATSESAVASPPPADRSDSDHEEGEDDDEDEHEDHEHEGGEDDD
jgi:hypothetical protein